jgi:hypothetical protein
MYSGICQVRQLLDIVKKLVLGAISSGLKFKALFQRMQIVLEQGVA